MKTTEEMNSGMPGMEALNKDLDVLREEDLSQVSGGVKGLAGAGIQWDDPRCERCARRARIFASQFQECNLYEQKDKDEVKALCEEMAKYVYTPEYFDLVKAMTTFVHLSAKTHVFSMTVTATAGWNIFVGAFNAIIE